MGTFSCRSETFRRFRGCGSRLLRIKFGTRFTNTLTGPSAEFMGTLICTTMNVVNTLFTITNALSIKRLSYFLACTGRCAGPFGRIANMLARLRANVTTTKQIFRILRTSGRVPSGDAGRLRRYRNGIEVRGMGFSCAGRGPLVAGFSLSIGDNDRVTVINPANYNGAAFVGLLVEFCSASDNGVDVSNISVVSVAHSGLEGYCKVILRSD